MLRFFEVLKSTFLDFFFAGYAPGLHQKVGATGTSNKHVGTGSPRITHLYGYGCGLRMEWTGSRKSWKVVWEVPAARCYFIYAVSDYRGISGMAHIEMSNSTPVFHPVRFQ
jgi:hypothetical protein